MGRSYPWLGRKNVVYSVEQVAGTPPHVPVFTGFLIIDGVEGSATTSKGPARRPSGPSASLPAHLARSVLLTLFPL